MMIWMQIIFNIAIAMLKATSAVLDYLERQSAIDDGMKRQLSIDTAAVARAGSFSADLRARIDLMTESELDAGLLK
ncbi:hypothetical protein [Breoghania sp.]|uniref:hypothetical protein n=1 Tax=Breoghania sp. TaxID=2065378 RepID=UPI002AA71F60|nr:hypothetical protein [Breoghania sp.]